MYIRISNAVVNNPLQRLSAPVSLNIEEGECVAILGENGSGKSLLANILMDTFPLASGEAAYNFDSASEWVYENVKMLTFRDAYGSPDGEFYYQQRWNSTEHDNYPTVRELLSGKSIRENVFGIAENADKKLVYLSSGELRKFHIVKALESSPKFLILDNPFIGLDEQSRMLFVEILRELSKKIGVILLLSRFNFIPDFVTHVVTVEKCSVFKKYAIADYVRLNPLLNGKKVCLPDAVRDAILNLEEGESVSCPYVVRLKDVSIRYGTRFILRGVDWEIKNGDAWALLGENGCGKSTLLSLITADNPQSYACDIELFGRKRGTGETIWDIKKNIGYVSPELHRAFQKNVSVREIVASGLLDTMGLYVKAPEEKMGFCDFWMDVFGISGLSERNFLRISSGEQRLALLARAFVKDPQLIILDEPFHGLDTFNREKVREIIETFCRRRNKTLIMVTHYKEELPSCIANVKVLEKAGRDTL